jgi:tetratricopeptide (TPR) repeat protein
LEPSFNELEGTLMKILKFSGDIQSFRRSFCIKYRDDENDLIQVSSEEEFQEAVSISKSIHGGLRLSIQSIETTQNVSRPKCRWFELHKKALRLFDSHQPSDLALARKLLLEQSSLSPNHPIPLYNLACAESRLNNKNEALSYLQKALENGYRDMNHIKKDTDLDSLRDMDDFHILISQYENTSTSSSSHSSNPWKKGRCGRRFKIWKLESEIQKLFKSGSVQDLELARKLLLEQLSVAETAHSLYNLACVESLLKNEETALLYLKKAIDGGFRDARHIDNDKDLDFIRHTPSFQVLRQQLENGTSNYENALKLLAEMGWTCTDQNIRILNQTNGDLATTIAILMSNQ